MLLHHKVTYYQHFVGSRKLVEAVGPIVPQASSVSLPVSGQASYTQDRAQGMYFDGYHTILQYNHWTLIPVSGNQNACARGRTYSFESRTPGPSQRPSRPLRQPSQPSRPSQPQGAARHHGYTQNHAHYRNRLDDWSRKTSPSGSGSVDELVAILVFMGVVHPGQKSLTIINVSVL